MEGLNSLISADFYVCEIHASRSKCNYFCMNCKSSLCHCKKGAHVDHKLLQVYKVSYQTGVKIDEIKDRLDISGIQIYKINKHSVIFIKQRRDQELGINNGQSDKKSVKCEICGWKLLTDTSKFCSMECKDKSIRADIDSYVQEGREECRRKRVFRDTIAHNSNGNPIEPITQNSNGHLVEPVSKSITSFRKRSRKGIPQRAPFF